MILGSHNSWSFLPPKKWWQKVLAFTARCQRKTIQEQYELGVRCFDLRIRFIKGDPYVVHNSFVYASIFDVYNDLNFLNNECNVCVRILHDVRKKKDYTDVSQDSFWNLCSYLKRRFTNIKWWCGRNLYNWEEDFVFDYKPRCTEMYSSVCSPKLIDDWFPLIYAKRNNSWIRRDEYKEDEILLIDFVDIK